MGQGEAADHGNGDRPVLRADTVVDGRDDLPEQVSRRTTRSREKQRLLGTRHMMIHQEL